MQIWLPLRYPVLGTEKYLFSCWLTTVAVGLRRCSIARALILKITCLGAVCFFSRRQEVWTGFMDEGDNSNLNCLID